MEQHILRYEKYMYEVLSSIDIDTATYKEHLHKPFEWFGCIQLSIQYNSTFLRWEDVPPQLREEKGMSRDMGIDAWDIEGNHVSQMKLYQGCITNHSISTYIMACFTHFDSSIKILFRNTESKITQMITDCITQGKLLDISRSDFEFRSECKRIQALTIPKSTLPDSLVIRQYQLKSITYLEKGKDTNKNVYLCIPTGCGKTLIILQYHSHYHTELLLVLVPRVVLMDQWGEECIKLGIKPYLIGTGHHHNMDQFKDETIVICVYDSFPNIYDQKDRFSRYCIDEAHHIKTPERYMDTELEHEVHHNSDSDIDNEEEVKEEHMSYIKCIQTLSESKRTIYISATLDPPQDDSLFYEYKVRKAIEEGYLCDFQFVFPIFEQEHITYEHLAYYLVNKQHESHCVIYSSTCKDGKEFTTLLNVLRKGCAKYIDSETPYEERKRIFKAFEDGQIQFLVNPRLLVEGFNAPHIRSIFFLRVSTSEIFIIQAIGRALRKHQDKLLATIYVPFTQESDLERIQTFINQLSTYDERIKQTIEEKKIGGYISIEHGEDIEEETDQDDTIMDIFKVRYNLIVDSMGDSEQLENIQLHKAMKYKQFYEEHDRKPKYISDKTTSEYHLARFYGWMKCVKKGSLTMKLYPSVEQVFIDLFGELWFNNHGEIQGMRTVKEYKEWINIHKKQPLQCLCEHKKKKTATKEQKEEHRLATWFRNIKIAKMNGRIYQSVEEILIKELGEDWYKNRDLEELSLDYCKKYILWYHIHKRHASEVLDKRKIIVSTKENEEEHRLAQWYGRTRTTKNNPIRKTVVYSSVEKLLIESFGPDWYKNRDLEAISLETAREYAIFFTLNKRQAKDISKPKNDLEKSEKKLNQWFSDMRKAKMQKGKRKLYLSVESILVESIGETWYENINLESVCLNMAQEYVSWFIENKRHAQTLSKTLKETASNERLHESELAEWINRMKGAKKGISTCILYGSTENLLQVTFGDDWFENKDRESLSLDKIKEYVHWYDTNKKHPSQKIHSKKEKETATEEKLKENTLAAWMQCMKKSKKKHTRDSMTIYPSVEKILVEKFGSDWYI